MNFYQAMDAVLQGRRVNRLSRARNSYIFGAWAELMEVYKGGQPIQAIFLLDDLRAEDWYIVEEEPKTLEQRVAALERWRERREPKEGEKRWIG